MESRRTHREQKPIASPKAQKPSHTKGVKRGEERVKNGGAEPGREGPTPTMRSATSINPSAREPIDKRMPHLPPA